MDAIYKGPRYLNATQLAMIEEARLIWGDLAAERLRDLFETDPDAIVTVGGMQ